jgi:hypothetical protein
VRVFALGPHRLGPAGGAGDAAAWTTLAASCMIEQSETRRIANPMEDPA